MFPDWSETGISIIFRTWTLKDCWQLLTKPFSKMMLSWLFLTVVCNFKAKQEKKRSMKLHLFTPCPHTKVEFLFRVTKKCNMTFFEPDDNRDVDKLF